MARYLATAAIAFLALTAGLTQAGGEKDKVKDFVAKGKFTKDDPKDAQRGGASHLFTVPMKMGKVYIIDLVGSGGGLDPFLRLLDPTSKQLDEDDDSGGDLNSRIQFSCPKDGDYKVVATTLGQNQYGSFTLTVKTAGAAQKPSTGHSQMVGKDAPDFRGAFALNGKPIALSELKGKVVLLYFWECRSSASVAYLPKLSDWHKKFKDDGLAVVGVSYFASDIGQKLGFDAESGEIKTVAKANQASDEALLKAFADHHKVEHLQLVLSKKDALSTFNTYVVNGVPQVVVLDRKGVVRHIDINGEKKNTAAVETEFKKLLAEK